MIVIIIKTLGQIVVVVYDSIRVIQYSFGKALDRVYGEYMCLGFVFDAVLVCIPYKQVPRVGSSFYCYFTAL